MLFASGFLAGLVIWFVVRCCLIGIYTVDQNERAVKTVFGRAERVPGGKTTLDDPIAEGLRPDEKDRYVYPQVRVIQPGVYFKMPWEKDLQNLHRHHHHEHGGGPGRSHGEQWRPPSGSGDQGPAQHRTHRADPLPRQRGESVRVYLRHQEADGARDGIFRFRSAAEDRRLRGEAAAGERGRSGKRHRGDGNLHQRSAKKLCAI